MLDAFKSTILELLGSKKFLLLVAGLIAWALARLGFNVDQAQIDRGLELLGALIVAQGVADHGKPAAEAKAAADVAIAKIHAGMPPANENTPPDSPRAKAA
jgi:hypothetical protein